MNKWECGAENASDIIATLTDNTLILEGKGRMKDFSSIEKYSSCDIEAFISNSLGHNGKEGNISYYAAIRPWSKPNVVEKIIINEGITHIGDCAFLGADIVSVEIPNSVKTIGYAAFKYCYKLEKISIPEYIEYIGERAFESCNKLNIVVCLSTSLHYKLYSFLQDLSNVTHTKSITFFANYAYKNFSGISWWFDKCKKVEFFPTLQQIDAEISEKTIQITKLECEIRSLQKKKENIEFIEKKNTLFATISTFFNQNYTKVL